MRILIAEDDPVSRLMLQATLKKWGHEPILSCDGSEALAILEAPSAPAIAILDWMMPELDGPEVCRRLRASSAAQPYIILLTAKTRREDVVAGLNAGADDYMTKPFQREELHARLQAGIRIMDLQTKLAARVLDLKVAMTRLSLMQQEQKLESLGQMAAGIAHEINTPTQYIGDNLRFLQESWAVIGPMIPATNDSETQRLLREVPKAIADSVIGVERVARIVGAMREFCHPSGTDKVPTDLNRAIETTIAVSINEWKYVADMETELDSALPPVMCLPSEIQQVVLSLIINAAHAIGDAVKRTGGKGTIRIATVKDADAVEIRIADTGVGIPEEYRERVFDPFFTTKEVGKGTGQGLTLAYAVVTRQHGGTIRFESEVGKGTQFSIRLPLDGNGKTSG